MNILCAEPKSRMQKKIAETADELIAKGLDLFEVDKCIRSMFPLMSDTDMYFLDLKLGCAHGIGKRVGDIVFAGAKIILRMKEENFLPPYDVEYNIFTRSHFCDIDAHGYGTNFMGAAVKLANCNYGVGESTVEFDAVLEVEWEDDPVFIKECSATLHKSEYTHVMYFPIAPLKTLGCFTANNAGGYVYLSLYKRGTKELVLRERCLYINTQRTLVPDFRLIHDEYATDDMDTRIIWGQSMTGNLQLFFATPYYYSTVELEVKVYPLDDELALPVFVTTIEAYRYFDDKFLYFGNIFGNLERLNRCIFESGEYKVNFYVMGQYLFSVNMHAQGGFLSKEIDGHCGNFYEVEKLGILYDGPGSIEDFDSKLDEFIMEQYMKYGHDEDDEEFDEEEDEEFDDEEDEEFDEEDDDGEEADEDEEEDNEDDDEAVDEDEEAEFRRLLDEFLEEKEEEERRLISPEREASITATLYAHKDDVPLKCKASDWFFIRPGDKYIHLNMSLTSKYLNKDIEVIWRCLSEEGKTRVANMSVSGETEVNDVIPLEDLYSGYISPGDRIDFEIELGNVDGVVAKKQFAGFVISNIFNVIELGDVMLYNHLNKENGSMKSFKDGSLAVLEPQLELKFPEQMTSLSDMCMFSLETPQGEVFSEDIEGCLNGNRWTFWARFGNDDNIEWNSGRYTLKAYVKDNKFYEDEFATLTFTVGEWALGGLYSGSFIKREILDDLYRKGLGKAQFANPHKVNVADSPAFAKLNGLIGLSSVKAEIDSLCKQLNLAKKREEAGLPGDMPFLHSRFYGNPGTGKTTVAKLLGQVYKEMGFLSKGHVVFAERKTLIAGRYYDSANVATMEAIDKAQGGILFIDEAYNLYVQNDPRDPGQDIISCLLTALADDNRKDWMLILAGYPLPMETMIKSNAGLESRVPNVFHFYDYNEDELMQIALKYCHDHVYTLTPKAREQLKMVIDRDYAKRPGNFANGRYVISLLENKVIKAMGHRLSAEEHLTGEMLTTILPEDIPYLADVKGSKKLEKLQKMIGMEELKESIMSHLNYVKLCNNRLKAGLSSQMPSMNMIFEGNPGTGKTTVADFIGDIYASLGILSEGNVIKVTKKDLVGVWIGETEQNMKNILSRAKGNVLFIDEAYQLNPKGNAKDPGRIIIDALVDELGGDNPNMIVIMAGYEKDMNELLEVNEGLKSRFPKVFHFNDYSVEELVRIAMESKAAKDYIFTPTAKERLEAYIKREVLKKQTGFGNGRFVHRLLTGVILPRMATRLSGIENPTRKQLQTILAEDIPITAQEVQQVLDAGFDNQLIDDSLAKLDSMIGLEKVKQAIHNFVDVARYRNSIGEKFVGNGVLKWSFTGNTGTGKSTVAKIFADILKGMNLLAKGNFVEVKGEQIFNVSEYTCDQVLKAAVDKSRYGMLFIDGDAPEFKERNGYNLTNEQLKIKLSSLTSEMGGVGAIIVAECNSKRQTMVSSLASNGIYEFDHTMVFDDYTPAELYRILVQCLAAHKVRFTPEATACLNKYIEDMAADKGAQVANARTMKLLSRTIYEIIMLRESKDTTTPRRTVCLCDVERFVWKTERRKLGY